MTGLVSILTLERTRVSTLYIDGTEIGTCDSLCSSHRYDISSYMTAGTHEIVIRVANVGYKTGGGHMTSPDTQTNWLGIVGKMNIEIYPKSYISDVRVIASADGRETDPISAAEILKSDIAFTAFCKAKDTEENTQ